MLIQPVPDLRAVEAIVARTLNGHVLQVRARAYVLACGGIENARLLLASNRVAPAGIGNEYDLVGRFFMDHPYLTTGYFAPASQQHADGPHVIQSFKRAGFGQKCHIGFVLSERVRRDEQLTGCSAYFIRRLASETAPEYFSRGGKSRLRLAEFLEHRTSTGADLGSHLCTVAKGWREVGVTLARRASEVIRPRHVLAIRTVLETGPRPDSRVTVTTARDRLGMPCVRVDWRISESDRRGLDRLRGAMGKAIQSRGLGILVEDPHVDEVRLASVDGGRQTPHGHDPNACDPKRGVVDSDGRVHGIANLYIAGSSVFPTSGHANPTFTIVVLALRLADHLKAEFGAGP